MFEFVTWLITNKCGMGCDYCDFINRGHQERTEEELLEAIDIMSKWPGAKDRFICILGGDLIALPEQTLHKMVDLMNAKDMLYGFQTSAYNAKKMESILPKIRNLSISVDPVPDDLGRWQKACQGLFWAGKAKQINPDMDVHATITVDRTNYKNVVPAVRMLSSLGIWAEITFVHWDKPGFDLVPAKNLVGGFEQADMCSLKALLQELLKMKKAGFLIHSSEEYLKMVPEHIVNLDWQCTRPSNLVLDVDLSIRECLHLPGNRVQTWTLRDIADPKDWGKFLDVWKKDQQDLCPKCMWDCQVELEKTFEAGKCKDWFDHKI